ncbi:putative FHA domain-containing protein [Gammaproteobacteria bacterium]
MATIRFIVLNTSNEKVSVIKVEGETFEIGRSLECAVSINDPYSSRHQARVTLSPRGYVIEALGSNPTLLNATAAHGRILGNGDILQFGNTRLLVELAQDDKDATMVLPPKAKTVPPPEFSSDATMVLPPKVKIAPSPEFSSDATMVLPPKVKTVPPPEFNSDATMVLPPKTKTVPPPEFNSDATMVLPPKAKTVPPPEFNSDATMVLPPKAKTIPPPETKAATPSKITLMERLRNFLK